MSPGQRFFAVGPEVGFWLDRGWCVEEGEEVVKKELGEELNFEPTKMSLEKEDKWPFEKMTPENYIALHGEKGKNSGLAKRVLDFMLSG